MEIDLDEIPSSPSSDLEVVSFDDLTSSVRFISNSPSYPLISSPSPIYYSEGLVDSISAVRKILGQL